ncbi:hypothetical protein M9H77_12122 [Catharanthus roseus]|uniref:Uncharacterized protein n=1 Tax=Catharanthus roseus TaxID=4058 RepID=A0ACC0BGP5_CATRO|nr:hypothetical protein M9H77_12122 [Catharanthus roseus]
MCPLRFLLVFFSALLAAYIAWRTARSSKEEEEEEKTQGSSSLLSENSTPAAAAPKEFCIHVSLMMQNGFWVFIDMATGRYLWKNVKEMSQQPKST